MPHDPQTQGADWPPDFLPAWLVSQRWFGKSHAPEVRSLGSWPVDAAEAGVRIQTHLLEAESPLGPVLYQVPIVERSLPLAGGESALIAERGSHFYYDAPHDPAYASALLRLIGEEGRSLQGMPKASGTRLAPLGQPERYASRVLGGEQSNTSIVYEPVDAGTDPAIICKLYRVIHGGENPDIALHRALAAFGSSRVSRPIGYLTGEWSGSGRPAERITGHLAFAQEFIGDAPDAWRVAVQAASHGEDFSARAHELGTAIAEVHGTLAEAMPTTAAQPGSIEAIVSAMSARSRAAEKEVPQLVQFRSAIESGLDAALRVPWPRLQRIHGDFHLGQVLDAPGRGWIVIDFEGEPLVPLSERGRPDTVMRDIAGMLRSFSYVGGTLADAGRQADVTGWVARCRASFLDGYASVSDLDPREHEVLLAAFELDKAVYEARYEARNRPSWLPIPLAAIRRLTAPGAGRLRP